MEELRVFTIEEVSQLLRTSDKVVLDEIQKGQLQAFLIGGAWRITHASINDFISAGGSRTVATDPGLAVNLPQSSFKRISPLQHTWPNGAVEDYPDAYETSIRNSDGQFEIKIGIGERSVSGMRRKRIVVFVDRRPTVEFAGGDDFDEDGLVASIVTLPNRKRLKPRQPIPNEYQGFDLRPYNSIVRGPRALSTMAVIAHVDDLVTMTSHALIRVKYRDRS